MPVAARCNSVSLRPLACWDCWFETHMEHDGAFLVSVVFRQVDISESGSSFVQRSPTEFGVSECDSEASIMRKGCPNRGSGAMEMLHILSVWL